MGCAFWFVPPKRYTLIDARKERSRCRRRTSQPGGNCARQSGKGTESLSVSVFDCACPTLSCHTVGSITVAFGIFPDWTGRESILRRPGAHNSEYKIPPTQKETEMRKIVWLFFVCLPVVALPQSRISTADDYARAEKFLAPNLAPLVVGGSVSVKWLEGDRFWYRRTTDSGVATSSIRQNGRVCHTRRQPRTQRRRKGRVAAGAS